MATRPSFFFSHARQDMHSRYLQRFFEDLEQTLASWCGVAPPLGTIDRRIEHGDNWDQALSQGLMQDKVFIAVLTPTYPTRPNCGKELGVFLLRNPELDISANGELTGVQNVLVLRWKSPDAYEINGIKDAVVPSILRLIQDGPGDDMENIERSRAIDRYRRDGMELCVRPGARYYQILLELLARRIRDMRELPPATGVDFNSAINAFEHDWHGYLAGRNGTERPSPDTTSCASPASSVPAQTPMPLQSLVVFYVTQRQHTVATAQASFPYSLIVEPVSGLPCPTDPQFAALMADMRIAAVHEGLGVFHATSPAEALLPRLEELAHLDVLTFVVIDPELWTATASNQIKKVLDEVAASQAWRGPVFIPAYGGAPRPPAAALPVRVRPLPGTQAERVSALRHAMVESRGEILRASHRRSSGTQRVPLLQGIGGDAR